jgi:hypothetical protein
MTWIDPAHDVVAVLRWIDMAGVERLHRAGERGAG